MKKIISIMGMGLLLWSSMGWANQMPRALSTDTRMRVVPYNANDVVTVVGSPLVTTSIEFGSDESVDSVQGGDQAAWEVYVNKAHPNVVFIKPTMNESDSNMTVLTNEYVYHFRLLMATPGEHQKPLIPTYNIRFTYPEKMRLELAAKAKQVAQEKNALVADNQSSPLDWNWDYSFSCQCSQDNVPIRAFDDGKFTYFQFAPHADIPAIFLVDGQGNESLTNWHMKGQYVVIERTGRQFTLRNGDSASCVFNEHYSA